MMDYKLNSYLAEVCGIHAGDGYLRNDGKRRELTIEGSFEEKEYYDKHVVPLFSRVFNIDIKNCKYHPLRGTYGFSIRDIKVIKFMHSLGFPYGKKSLIVRAPCFVFENTKLVVPFLRGYFDTDGCLAFSNKPCIGYSEFKRVKHYYPSILFSTVSFPLFLDVNLMLKYTHFKFFNCIYKSKKETESLRYRTVLSGVNEMLTFLNIIGISNPVKSSRYLVWKKYGFCPTKTRYTQRLKMIEGSLNPEEFYKKGL